MTYIDKFKINWTEKSQGRLITSVSGYSYQIKSWEKDYLNKYSVKEYDTTTLAKVDNSDGTMTITVSRKINR
mgnify:CR=1 FL=1|tara:strand:+ start:484 stop:699 length:216 start_codon:yes stop_codon:yes gene_type:complete